MQVQSIVKQLDGTITTELVTIDIPDPQFVIAIADRDRSSQESDLKRAAIAVRDRIDASDVPSLGEGLASIIGLKSEDVAKDRITVLTGDAFERLTRLLSADAGVKSALSKRFIRIDADSPWLPETYILLKSFAMSDVGPVLRALVDADAPSSGDATLDALLRGLDAHHPRTDVAALRESLRPLASKCGPLSNALRDVSPFAACALFAYVIISVLLQVAGATVNAHLASALNGVCALLLNRWAAKLDFNRADVREEDEKRVKEDREAIKRRKIDVLENMSEDDKEFLRAYRKAMNRDVWDYVERDAINRPDAYAHGKGRPTTDAVETGASFTNASVDGRADRSRGVEDARDMYWLDDEHDERNADDGDNIDDNDVDR